MKTKPTTPPQGAMETAKILAGFGVSFAAVTWFFAPKVSTGSAQPYVALVLGLAMGVGAVSATYKWRDSFFMLGVLHATLCVAGLCAFGVAALLDSEHLSMAVVATIVATFVGEAFGLLLLRPSYIWELPTPR